MLGNDFKELASYSCTLLSIIQNILKNTYFYKSPYKPRNRNNINHTWEFGEEIIMIIQVFSDVD